MLKERPLLSIIVPSFNQAEFLGATLDSIFGQKYLPHEVLVMDGASTDGSVDVIKKYATQFPTLRWVSEPDNGPADAVNKGLERVTGEVIGIQSSDDIYYPGAFQAAVDVFAKHPDCGLVYGDLDRIDAQNNFLYEQRFPDFSWEAYFGISCSIIQSSIFFRTEVAKDAGGWNGEIYSCDLDYWLRLLFRTQAIHIPQILSAWRHYDGQRTQFDTHQKIWDGYWRMIDESPEIARATPKIRRLAQASKHLRVLRSPPSKSMFFAYRHLLIAFIKHPGFWRYHPLRSLLRWLPGSNYARSVFIFSRKYLGMAPQKTVPTVKPE